MSSSVQSVLTSSLVVGVSAVEVTLPDGSTAVCAVEALTGKRGCKGNTVATLRDLLTGETLLAGWNPEARDAAGHAVPVPAALRVLPLAEVMEFARANQATVTASVEVSTDEVVDAPLTSAILADLEQADAAEALLAAGEVSADA